VPYHLTGTSRPNVGSVYAGPYVMLKINSADVAWVQQFYGGGTATLLQTIGIDPDYRLDVLERLLMAEGWPDDGSP
jgi:hypothetical protein